MSRDAALLHKARRYLESAKLLCDFEKRQRADYLADAGLDATDVGQLIEDVDAFARASRARREGSDAA